MVINYITQTEEIFIVPALRRKISREKTDQNYPQRHLAVTSKCLSQPNIVLHLLNILLRIYPPITRKRLKRYKVASHLSTLYDDAISLGSFLNRSKSKLAACSPRCPLCCESSKEAANTNFKDIGLTGHRVKSEFIHSTI